MYMDGTEMCIPMSKVALGRYHLDLAAWSGIGRYTAGSE
jgi:hypothetical protein